MAEAARFWAGKAVSRERLAASYGRLDDERPSSTVLLFKAGAQPEWGYVDLPRTVVSIAFHGAASKDEGCFLALSNEGDVYRLEGDVPHEKIPGAGVLSEDATDRGSMNALVSRGERLYAVGNGCQIYVREREGSWRLLVEPASLGSLKIDFSSTAERSPDVVVAVGATQLTYRRPTEEEEATLARIRKEGPNSRFLAYRREIMRVERYVEGSLALVRSGELSELGTSRRHPLNDVVRTADANVVGVGDGGTILRCDPTGGVTQVEGAAIREKLRAIREVDSQLFVLGERSIFVLGPDLSVVESIELPRAPASPFSMDVGPSWIVVFRHDGISIREGRDWRDVVVPKALLDRAGQA